MRIAFLSGPSISICWMLGAFAVVGSAQPTSPASATFEVASVKQLEETSRPGQPDLSFVGTAGKPFKIAGTRVTIQGTARALIEAAYDVKDYQISKVPEWADNLLYVVTAKTPGEVEPGQDQFRPMLQALLAERFRLKFHRDAKELPVYHLVQAKKSRLFKAAAPDETFSWRLSPGPGGTLRSKATKESIGDFVQLVGVSTDKPVIDRTGISGFIDYDILISPPEGRSQEDTNRAIVYAVVDQLGLKLEPGKDSIEMLMVDELEKPSAD